MEVKQCNSHLNVLYNLYPFPVSTTPLNQLTTYLTLWPNQLTAPNNSAIAVQLSCTSHYTHPCTHMQAHMHTLAGIHAPLCTQTCTPPCLTQLQLSHLQISIIAYNTPLSQYNTYHTNQIL